MELLTVKLFKRKFIFPSPNMRKVRTDKKQYILYISFYFERGRNDF